MQTLEQHGHTLAYVDRGAGPPVVLLHSGGLSSRQWERLGALLSPSFHVLAPDFLGYGSSSGWPATDAFALDDDGALIHALLDRIGAPAHLVGHSYGGLLALRIACRREVRSLAVFEPVAFGLHHDGSDAEAMRDMNATEYLWNDDARGGDEAWLRGFVDYWNGAPGSWESLTAAFRQSYLAVGRKVYQEAHAVWGDRTPLSAYQAITTPTLVLSGDRSPIAERRVCSRLAAAIPNARLIELAGVGHMGPLTHAGLVNAAIAEHLSRASAS